MARTGGEGAALATTDHDTIRQWVAERAGRPAVVRDTHDGTSGILRIDFAEPDTELEEISWEEFFRIFDDNELAFLYQKETADGEPSYFSKFVARDSLEEEEDDETE